MQASKHFGFGFLACARASAGACKGHAGGMGLLPSNRPLGGSYLELSSQPLGMALAHRFFPGALGHSAGGQGVCAGVPEEEMAGKAMLA